MAGPGVSSEVALGGIFERLQLRKQSKFRFLYDLKSTQVKWRCGLALQGEPLVEAPARSLICACVANHGRPCPAIPVITLSSIRNR